MPAQNVRDALTDPVPRMVWGIVVGAVGVLIVTAIVFRNQ
jgi:hypothetical protein